MELESDNVNSGGAAEDYVHVEEAGAAESSIFGAASVTDSEWRSEENDELFSRIGGGGGGGGEGVNDDDDNERKELTEELSMGVVKLTCESTAAEGGICDVYLVGTAHVSTESCKEVEAVISFLKPQVVFLELCPSRVTVLQPQNLKVPTIGEMVNMWKKNHNLFGILYGWFLAKVASQLAVFPGAEFRVAFEEAMKYGGKVILGDRPVQQVVLSKIICDEVLYTNYLTTGSFGGPLHECKKICVPMNWKGKHWYMATIGMTKGIVWIYDSVPGNKQVNESREKDVKIVCGMIQEALVCGFPSEQVSDISSFTISRFDWCPKQDNGLFRMKLVLVSPLMFFWTQQMTCITCVSMILLGWSICLNDLLNHTAGFH